MNEPTRPLPNFRSDNVAPVSPEILQAIAGANYAPAASYGDDDYSKLLNRRFSMLFETEVTVFPVATGTAANALSLAACAAIWSHLLPRGGACPHGGRRRDRSLHRRREAPHPAR